MRDQERRVGRLAERMYEDLGPKERVRLVIALEAQKNYEESVRVAAACPTEDYRAPEPAYTFRIRTAYQLALQAAFGIIEKYRFVLFLLPALEKMYLTGTKLWQMCAAAQYAPNTGRDILEVEKERDNFRQPLEGARKAAETYFEHAGSAAREFVLKQLKSEWQGLDACCREHLGVDARTLLQAWGGSVFFDWFEQIEPEIKEVEPGKEHKEHVEFFRAVYAEAFRGLPMENELDD